MQYPGRLIKVGEQDKALVDHITDGLKKLGYHGPSPKGVFDQDLKRLIMLFQSQNVDKAGLPLEIDGEVGSMTWGAIFGMEPVFLANGSIATLALGMAVSQLGVMEQPLGSNSGPQVNMYLKSVGLDGGYFWCMAFVHWCFQQAAAQAGQANPFPKTAGCIDAWNKVKRRDPSRVITRAQAMADPKLVKPGQVFILDYGKGMGHTGFVRQSFGGPLLTIEGNSNNGGSRNGLGVFELNRRKIPDQLLKGFIDLT